MVLSDVSGIAFPHFAFLTDSHTPQSLILLFSLPSGQNYGLEAEIHKKDFADSGGLPNLPPASLSLHFEDHP